jgi:hypothetical protein
MIFEMVGVQLDQAGQQQIAAEVLAMFRWTSFADFNNQAIGSGKPSGLDDSACQDDSGIG